MLYKNEINSLFSSFNKKTRKRKCRLSDLGTSISVAIPRVDYYISNIELIERREYKDIMLESFSGGLLDVLEDYYQKGRLGKFGFVADSSSYICRFGSIGIDYYWIPKNACTNYKKLFSLAEDAEFMKKVKESRFHETVQKKYGLSMQDYLSSDLKNHTSFCILRDPIERFVSCYIDKFAKPVCKGSDLEPYIKNIIENYYLKVGINADAAARSLTFIEFLHMVLNTPSFALNEHWRPQSNFISGFHINYLVSQKNAAFWAEEHGFTDKATVNTKENSSVGKVYTPGLYKGEFENQLPVNLDLHKVEDYSQFVSPASKLILEHFYREDYNFMKEGSFYDRC